MTSKRNFSTAKGRWEGVGPYYAMFPVGFADLVVASHSSPGHKLIDPFAGRGTALFSAAVAGRQAFGVEISPVGWVYGQAKLQTAPCQDVEANIRSISRNARGMSSNEVAELPEFFGWCYSTRVLKFLLAARQYLDWKTKAADWTTMALILIYLHGKRGQNLSNQMRQGKAMSPGYSVRWWKERELSAPDIDPEEFMLSRVRWRYAKGVPEVSNSQLLLGDSCARLSDLERHGPFNILLTSPPYIGVTNYHYDQWLRLWMLGDEPYPRSSGDPHRGRFDSARDYEVLLATVFGSVAKMMAPGAVAYVRTDARLKTLDITRRVLTDAFAGWKFTEIACPYKKNTQTALYGDKKPKPGEVDIIIRSV